MFGEGFARRTAKRYRTKGLDPAASAMVDFLAADGLEGATVLEVGGGVGEIGIELLRRGAASVTCLELSSAYDVTARRLAEQAGVGDRVERRLLDIAAAPDQVAPADVVVLHRVVCCYPDYERLLGAVGDHCLGRLAFSHPPRNVGSRAVLATQNAMFALARKEFRAFAHPPAAMLRVLTDRGFRPLLAHRGFIWQADGLVRAA
jgi:2-polyprenyl-3-methyl-5-hydroxy-6-metoxy-1,4-benzoquinol methylase